MQIEATLGLNKCIKFIGGAVIIWTVLLWLMFIFIIFILSINLIHAYYHVWANAVESTVAFV